MQLKANAAEGDCFAHGYASVFLFPRDELKGIKNKGGHAELIEASPEYGTIGVSTHSTGFSSTYPSLKRVALACLLG